jgi:hypothetical protein
VAIVLVALVLTGLNAGKPLVIDDYAYYRYARHILEAPTDPYGFELIWFDRIQHANTILVPPVLPYYLALVISMTGEHPVAWKLALFPFALLLSLAMWQLLGRFAPRGRIPLLCLAILSPTILPAFNLMLDVPMLALALAGLALLIRAGDAGEGGTRLAVIAGVVAGLALLTKYNAVLPFAAGLLYLLLSGHWRRALLAGTCASILFVGWEAYVTSRYGTPHLLNAFRLISTFPDGTPAQWLFCFASVAGAGLSALSLLGLTAARAPRIVTGVIAAGILLVLMAIALAPGAEVGSLGYFYPAWRKLGWVDWLLPITGLVTLLAAGIGLVRGSLSPLAVRVREVGPRQAMLEPSMRLDAFLLVWVAIELVGFFALSPFPALRRLIGLNVALVGALGRIAMRPSAGAPSSGNRVRNIATFGVLLALLFAVTDLGDALTRRRGVLQGIERIEALRAGQGGGTPWFVGHWGFRYYADRGGLRALIPNESMLREGDWLVIPRGVNQPRLRRSPAELERVEVLAVRSEWPWSTLPGAYAGYRSIRPQPDDQIQMQIYRVIRDFVPRAR